MPSKDTWHRDSWTLPECRIDLEGAGKIGLRSFEKKLKILMFLQKKLLMKNMVLVFLINYIKKGKI